VPISAPVEAKLASENLRALDWKVPTVLGTPTEILRDTTLVTLHRVIADSLRPGELLYGIYLYHPTDYSVTYFIRLRASGDKCLLLARGVYLET